MSLCEFVWVAENCFGIEFHFFVFVCDSSFDCCRVNMCVCVCVCDGHYYYCFVFFDNNTTTDYFKILYMRFLTFLSRDSKNNASTHHREKRDGYRRYDGILVRWKCGK